MEDNKPGWDFNDLITIGFQLLEIADNVAFKAAINQ